MKITLLLYGRTEESYIKQGIAEYEKRIKRYTSFEIIEIPASKKYKNLPEEQQKSVEGELIMHRIPEQSYTVLLDEKGKQHTSVEFAEHLNGLGNRSIKNLVYVVGGAYGFSEQVYAKVDERMSLSKMTFSHQMVRLIFAEQLYRAFTILRNEPYHHL